MKQVSRFSSAALAALLLVGGCAVGPDFRSPAPPEVSGYTADSLPEQTASAANSSGAAQKFLPYAIVAADWWTSFRAPDLNNLVEAALAKNPDLQAAAASLRAARENLAAGEGAEYPSLDGTVGASREKISGASAYAPGSTIPSFSLYTTGVSVSYPLDLFGGTQRTIEELAATAEGKRYALEAARLTLAGNVVTGAVQEAGLRAQIKATQEIIATQEKQRDLLKRQLDLGAVTKAALLAEDADLAATKATLPALNKQLTQTRHLLAALAGRFPSEKMEAAFTLDHLHLPEDLPLSIPSKLVAQRPDIKEVESQMHAASAAIGVAEAARYPQITLSGNYGLDAVQIGQLFGPGAAAWSVGGSLLQPLFHGGELEHNQRAAEALFDETAARYKSTVLSAFQNVADALRALESDAETLKARAESEHVAADSLALAETQFKAGSVSYLTLLNAQQTWQQAKIGLVQAEAQRFADTAALYVALGGGWNDIATPLDPDQATNTLKTEIKS
jgi:NodT family efflux transporter outer membrane factor (OMF) lipoprotein